jgi:radical SAM-linked protein
METLKRAFRRSGLRLAMSQGFHPQPRLSWLTALPLGLASLDEVLIFSLSDNLEPDNIEKNLELPAGLRINSLSRQRPGAPKPRAVASSWLLNSERPVFTKPGLPTEAHLSYTDPKRGPRDFILADFVLRADPLADPAQALLTLKLGNSGTPKPLDTARALWALPPDEPLEPLKVATVLDTDPLF